jgi:hypothetical protein
MPLFVPLLGANGRAACRGRLVDLGGSSSLSESSSAQRKVPLEVCGPDETPVHAIYFSGLLRLEQGGAVKVGGLSPDFPLLSGHRW